MGTKKRGNLKKITETSLRKKFPGSGLASAILVEEENILKIPSSVIAINHQIGGGLPYGKILELFGEESSGKTLLGIDFARNAQKMGGIVIWDDAEHSFTISWAIANGLDPKKIVLYQETSIEKVADWVFDNVLYYRSILTHNEPILFVLDSTAALECEENINTPQTDKKAEMGNRAKAIGLFLRDRKPFLSKAGVACIFINQLRSKIGASKFEDPDCLHYTTMIPFVDGRAFPIGEIVRDRIQGEVWSYNIKNGTFEPKPIIDWVKKEKLQKDEHWLQIKANGPGTKNGVFGIICTGKHGVLTVKGWRNAKDLILGDKLITKYTSILTLNSSLRNFMYGSFIGDSSLRLRSENTARYRLRDNENPEYVSWKVQKISPYIPMVKQNINLGVSYMSDYTVEFGVIAKTMGSRNPLIFGEHIHNPLSLAIWWMDDGHLSKRKNPQGILSISHNRTDIQKLTEQLTDWGFECHPRGNRAILFSTKGLHNLHFYIKKYIPECMQYKLLCEYRGQYKEFDLSVHPPTLLTLPLDILSIGKASAKAHRKLHKYDLTIADNHNFLAGNVANGLVVHNTTPGGQAMKFYADIRLGLYGGKQIVDKIMGFEEKVGRHVSIRVKKNKVAPPRSTLKAMEVYFNSEYEKKKVGFDKYCNLLDVLAKTKTVVKKSGGRYFMDGEMIAHGEEKFLRLLKDATFRKKIFANCPVNTLGKAKAQMIATTENLYPIVLSKTKEDEAEE